MALADQDRAAMQAFVRELELVCNAVAVVVDKAQALCTLDARKALVRALTALDSVFVVLSNDLEGP